MRTKREIAASHPNRAEACKQQCQVSAPERGFDACGGLCQQLRWDIIDTRSAT